MQLSALLSRLSSSDRKILLERRLGPNATSIDAKSLSTQLADPRSVAGALAELNTAQLLLLRWLSHRPGLQATWQELLDALGDRLRPELRDEYLTDLRLWGLADYIPQPKTGFFATYPAVVSVLPSRLRRPLGDLLGELNSDVLAKIVSALGLKTPATRKDERLRLLISTLTQPESCQVAVGRLSQPARELFEWVREQHGWVGAAAMQQRVPNRRQSYAYAYYSADSWWAPLPKGQSLDPLTELVRCALILPISPYAGGWYAPSAYAIPEETELAYSGRSLFDTAPLEPPKLEPAEGVEGTVPSPSSLLRDLAHLLGFVGSGRCEWKQDGEPYKRSLVALDKLLGRKDGAYAERLWDLAVMARLVQRDRRGDGWSVASVDATPLQLFQGVLLAWIETGARASGGVAPGRWQDARSHLLSLLGAMPPDTWVLKRSMEAWLRFQWPLIFAPGPQHFGASPPDPGWTSIQEIVLAHGKTADASEALMLPATHQRIIRMEGADDAAGALPPWDDGWIVQPDRTIVAPPNLHPDAVGELWQVAQLESSQGASVFRVSGATIAAALNRQLTPDQVRTLLGGRSRVPLPPTVERLIDDQGQRYGRIKVGTAGTYVRTDDPALLAELQKHAKLKKLEWREVAPGVAFVHGNDPDNVIQALRGAGYLPVRDLSEAEQASVRAAERQTESAAGSISTIDRRTMRRMIREAIDGDLLLMVTWLDRGKPRTAEIAPFDLQGDVLYAQNVDSGKDVTISLGMILALSELGGDDLDDDLDEADVASIGELANLLGLPNPFGRERRW